MDPVYTMEVVEVGALVELPVNAVRMPRARFMEIVDETLVDYPELVSYLRPIAERMERFPFHAWVVSSRGCGCIVGEYLIETDPRSRLAFVNAYGPFDGEWVEEVLGDRGLLDLAHSFILFGSDVDTALEEEIQKYLDPDADFFGELQVLLIED